MTQVNKKALARKRIFAQTPFSQSTSSEKILGPKTTLFDSTSCFGVTKITTPIGLQKS